MRVSLLALLLCCLFTQACCCRDASVHRHICLVHQEGPFEDLGDLPGVGLVFGTADFESDGFVLIKLQVGEVDSNDEVTIKAWSGNGSQPADASVVPPPDSSLVYSSGGDVVLRHWTNHLNREYRVSDDSYWIFVHVDLKREYNPVREPHYLWFKWQPSSSTTPDTPHKFNEYPSPSP